jgi:hypothetical protein
MKAHKIGNKIRNNQGTQTLGVVVAQRLISGAMEVILLKDTESDYTAYTINGAGLILFEAQFKTLAKAAKEYRF